MTLALRLTSPVPNDARSMRVEAVTFLPRWFLKCLNKGLSLLSIWDFLPCVAPTIRGGEVSSLSWCWTKGFERKKQAKLVPNPHLFWAVETPVPSTLQPAHVAGASRDQHPFLLQQCPPLSFPTHWQRCQPPSLLFSQGAEQVPD